MIKKCSRCGAPAPDEGSIFCNRCGSRLPSFLTCRKCGNTIPDLQASFCNRCGSPLVPPVQAAPPPITLAKGRICPACGFENFMEDASFCKKCGTVLGRSGSTGTVPGRMPQAGSTGIMHDGRSAGWREPAGMPAPPQYRPMNPPATVRAEPVIAAPVIQDLPGENGQDKQQVGGRRSLRKIALIAAAVVLIIIIIVVAVVVITPGIAGNSSANVTAPELPGALPSGILSVRAPAINGAAPVVTDTSLMMK